MPKSTRRDPQTLPPICPNPHRKSYLSCYQYKVFSDTNSSIFQVSNLQELKEQPLGCVKPIVN